MKVITIKNLDSLTREHVIELMYDTRLILVENKTEVPEKELVHFYHYLGDPVTFDDEYMSEEYVNTYTKGHRELIPVRNKEISGYGEPGLFSGGDDGEVKWHSESQNRDTHEDLVCFSMKSLSITGGDTWFMDQKVMYDNLIKLFPELDDINVDWTNRYSHGSPDNDLPYNPWTKWDGKCFKGGDGWRFNIIKDIDGVRMLNKEVKFKPLVTKNTITGQYGLVYPHQTVYKLQPVSDFLLQVLEKECEKEEYRYQHHWKIGDVLISDIQHSLHKRDSYTGDRLIYRTAIYMPENPNDPRKKHLH
jgi:alpha-ketoglutarate-dependent taurine dioxygenase